LQLPQCRTQPAATVERVGAIRFEPDSLVVILNRASVVALGLVSDASAVEGVCIVRVEPDRLVVVLDRAVSGTLVEIGGVAVLEGNGDLFATAHARISY
jgi:hypothetical protein